MKLYIVVNIDHYGGDMLECWCTFNEYSGLKVFTDRDEAELHAMEIEERFAQSARIEEVEVAV